jgi:hypothetical protein
MDITILLFILRIITAGLLLALLGIIFYAIWRDYRSTVDQMQATRRSYGQIIALMEVDDQFMATGERYPLLPLTSIGRAPTNSITIDDSFASGEHARITLVDGQWWLEDRQSRNGTMLNGAPLTESVIMTDGDMIGIGQTHFRLEFE